METKISVVIPAYNSSAYIEATVRSVLTQTRPAFEIIVVNDGSVDETEAILSKLPVKLISQKNQGVSQARNRGIEAASGDWIAFLDADDLWTEDKLASFEEHLRKEPRIDMVSTGFSSGTPETGWVGTTPRKSFDRKKSFFSQLYRRNFIATSSVIIRKSFLNTIGGFNPKLQVAEDLDLWLRAAKKGVNFSYLPESKLNYRLHPQSVTADPEKVKAQIQKVLLTHAKEAGALLVAEKLAVLHTLSLLGKLRRLRGSLWTF